MPFNRKTLTQLVDEAASDINAALPGADSRLRRSGLKVIGQVLAAAAHGLYGFLDWISRQVMVDTAETDYLNRWAAIWGITRKGATKAAGTATVIGNSGSPVTAGSVLQSSSPNSDPVEFTTDAEVIVVDGTAILDITAVEGAAAGNLAPGSLLTFATPLPGIATSASVVALEGGADAEADESLRERVLERIRKPPHGGSENDYVQRAREVPGVTRAWAYGGEMGLGNVTLRFMMDDVNAAFGGFPQGDSKPSTPTGDIATMQDYLDAEAWRPITAEIYAVAPIALPLDVTVEGLVPNTAETQAEVIAEIEDMIFREAVPGGKIPVSKIWEAASIAAGEQGHKITAPTDDVVMPTGYLSVLGVVTFV